MFYKPKAAGEELSFHQSSHLIISVFPEMDEVGEAISESSDVRPDAQGYAISCVCVCVSL